MITSSRIVIFIVIIIIKDFNLRRIAGNYWDKNQIQKARKP